MQSTPPSTGEVRSILRSAGLPASADIELLGDGWEMWAFRVGDQVVRLIKDPADAEMPVKLRREAAVSQIIAPSLPLPISVLDLHETSDGLFFSTHRIVPGVALREIQRPAAPGFGTALGRFLRALHAIPVEQFESLGVAVIEGPAQRERIIARYEEVILRVFPLVSCEARTYIARTYEAVINDASAFDYRPALIHNDIDRRNALGDPNTGELTGVIDFADVEVGDPRMDYLPAFISMFREMQIEDQLPDLFREGGIAESSLGTLPAFLDVSWCLNEITHGLNIHDPELIQGGIEALNEVVPYGMKC